MAELKFNPNHVTVGQAKGFRRLCGKDWMTYPLAGLANAPVEDHAAFYYLVMKQNDPAFDESMIDDVSIEQLGAMYEAITTALANPQSGSETDS